MVLGAASTGFFEIEKGTFPAEGLATPVQLLGNVVSATQGEPVIGEVLGSGDGSQANQRFILVPPRPDLRQ